MKNASGLLLISISIASLAFSQSATPPQNGSAQKKTVPKKTAPKTAATPASTKKGKALSSKSSSKSSSSKKSTKTAATWRNRQLTPTPERYREIQQALADKGYLKSEPNGVWDAHSVDALSRFQADRKLTPTGKINSASLIGLGLGPKNDASEPSVPAAESPAAVPVPPSAN